MFWNQLGDLIDLDPDPDPDTINPDPDTINPDPDTINPDPHPWYRHLKQGWIKFHILRGGAEVKSVGEEYQGVKRRREYEGCGEEYYVVKRGSAAEGISSVC